MTGDLALAAGGGVMVARTLSYRNARGHVQAAAGFAQSQVTFRKRHGVQVIPEGAHPDLLQNLNSRYRAQWNGPWIGAGVSISSLPGNIELDAVRHVRTAYSGEAEWNLRDDLAQPVSFVHGARGSGYDAGIKYSVAASSRFALAFAARRSTRNALHGYDIEYPVTGAPTRGHLGGVTSGNWAFRATIQSFH